MGTEIPIELQNGVVGNTFDADGGLAWSPIQKRRAHYFIAGGPPQS